MTAAVKEQNNLAPKGGRKGGSVFPRITLEDAIAYARKLVSKTHAGPQPQDVIFSGVVGAVSGRGQTRISALRQYGLLEGDIKKNYTAGELAKRIVSAPHEELCSFYREAILYPNIFKGLFNTFHGDTVSKAKLKQRAAALKVHPDETTSCVDIYISGMLKAELITIDGDQVTHIATSDNNYSDSKEIDIEATEDTAIIEDDVADDHDSKKATDANEENIPIATKHKSNADNPSLPQAVFNVNVTLDSSLDIEKLQKQLELLKRFGAI